VLAGHRVPAFQPAAVVARCQHTDAGSMQPDRWEEVLDHLSSMISGKRRADGATWRDAHENMPVYLQVCALRGSSARGRKPRTSVPALWLVLTGYGC
jgi:hypothetical protein